MSREQQHSELELQHERSETQNQRTTLGAEIKR